MKYFAGAPFKSRVLTNSAALDILFISTVDINVEGITLPSEKQKFERKNNYVSILKHLRHSGPKSRRELCESLDLSWGCVSELVSILLSKNILIEKPNIPNSRGRASSILYLNTDIYFLGIDINIMGLSACVCNLKGEFVSSCGEELKCNSKSEFTDSVIRLVNSVCQRHKNVYGITFAMQGIFNEKNCEWQFPSKKAITVNFSEDFGSMLKIPFTAEHDPECILYGHMKKPDSKVMLIRLDRGIGAAIYRENKFVRGEHFEPGYFVVNKNGDRLHDIISLDAIEKLAASTDSDKLNQHMHDIGRYLGTVLGNICNFISLDEICLCGDVLRYYGMFEESMKKSYLSAVLPSAKADISVIGVGNAAYGAAKIAVDSFGGTL